MALHARQTTGRLSVVLFALKTLQVGALDYSADPASFLVQDQWYGVNVSEMLERRATGAKRSSLMRSENDVRQSSSGHSGSHNRVSGYNADVISDNPVIYYRLDETDTTVINYGTLQSNGNGLAYRTNHYGAQTSPYWQQTSLLPSDTGNGAMRFFGFHDKVVLPNRTELNKNSAGYQQRSVEVWFLSDRYDNSNPHFLYEEGDQYTGLAIWLIEDGFGHGRLRMFAWNTPGFIIDNQTKTPYYGHNGVNTDPLDCVVHLGITNYAAFVFDGSAGSYKGYVRSEEQAALADCGTAASLPSGSKIMWHPDVGCIGNVCGKSRTGAAAADIRDDSVDSTFHGTIDEVAVYNTALTQAQAAAHATAGYG